MSEPPAGIDRRRHPRFDLIAQVRVLRGREDIIMELANISASGALLHMGKLKRPAWIAIDREIEIGIVHPRELDIVEVTGRIVRIVEDRSGVALGVDFQGLDRAAEEGVTRLLRAAGAPMPPPLPGR